VLDNCLLTLPENNPLIQAVKMKRKASPSQVVEEERLQKKPRREDTVVRYRPKQSSSKSLSLTITVNELNRLESRLVCHKELTKVFFPFWMQEKNHISAQSAQIGSRSSTKPTSK
jgi:hypothetical protein